MAFVRTRLNSGWIHQSRRVERNGIAPGPNPDWPSAPRVWEFKSPTRRQVPARLDGTGLLSPGCGFEACAGNHGLVAELH